MASDLPKVLHPLLGAPILEYMVEKVESLGCDPRVVVVGHGKEQILQAFEKRGLTWAHQDQQLGTGHAAAIGVEQLAGDGDVLILNGDLPLLEVETLRKLIELHRQRSADVTVLTCRKRIPRGYGRIIRNPASGKLTGIVEEKDASAEIRALDEINVGVYVFRLAAFRECFRKVGRDNAQGEYYLTDVVVAAARAGKKIETAAVADEQEIEQINSRRELAEVCGLVRRRILEELMDQGVTIVDPQSTFVEKGARIGRDTLLLPFLYICRDVEIGPRCQIGPFTYLRPGTVIREGASIGNFVEIKASTIGEGSKARHLAYIGDAAIGRKVNVGAGTIFANFDGRTKNRCVVKNGAFLGSGTILVAPVTVGEQAVTGAGAVIPKGRDVPDRTVVVGVPARPLRPPVENETSR